MLDDQSINIPCENCGKNTSKTIRWLKANKRFTCGCGTVINIDSSHLHREIKKVEKSVNDLAKKFR